MGSVLSVSPQSGSNTGGTTVTVIGTGFVAGTSRCRFAGNEETTVVSTSSQLTCITPSSGVTGTVALQISIDNGVTYSSSSESFLYYGPCLCIKYFVGDAPR
jgi:hypothetical protein